MANMRNLYVLVLASSCVAASAQRLPTNSRLTVRLDRTVSSRRAHVGDRIPASLAEDAYVSGHLLARRGSPMRAVVTYVKRSGRFHHSGYLTLRLASIDIKGRHYRLNSTAIRDKGDGHTQSNVEKIGGGAGLGAVIGALAGGGKGALLGGLLGGGAGTGLAAATGRQPAEFRSESVYHFTLTTAARHFRRYPR